MHNLIFFSVCLLFFPFGCKEGTPKQTTDSAGQSTAPRDPGKVTVETSLRGIYTLAEGINSFYDCDTDNTFWVNDASGTLESRYKQAVGSLTYPGEGVYAVVYGRVETGAAQGYAGNYAGTLLVSRVDTVQLKSRFNTCRLFDFWAIGTEPFWDLEISEAENGIFFKDVGAENGLAFPYVRPVMAGAAWTYTTRSKKGDTLKVVLKKEACSDGMSEISYPFSVEVTVNGEKRNGCAVDWASRKIEPPME